MPRILIVNPYGIGDVLFTTPVIRALREHAPNTFIGILLGSRTNPLLKLNPDLNIIFNYNKDIFRSLPLLRKGLYLLKLIWDIRKQNFDIFIDLSNTDEYAFFAKFIFRIPVRIGFQYRKRGRYLNYKTPLPQGFAQKHVSEHYQDLLKHLNISPSLEKTLYFYTDDSQKTWLKTLFMNHQISNNHKVICLLPGGGKSWGKGASFKYWPLKHYSKLAQLLAQKSEVKIVLIGAKEDQELCQKLKEEHPFLLDLSGKTTLEQLSLLIGQANLVIGNESGPLHLTVAIGTPSIAIYGPVDPQVYGPYSKYKKHETLFHEIPCHPCYQNFRMPPCENQICLKELLPKTVFERASLLLESK